jgi:hypothetical protein
MTTTKTYQAQLPLRNSRIVTPIPRPGPLRPPGEGKNKLEEIKQHCWRKFQDLLAEGSWYCLDHQGLCEREEGEHGQLAHCKACGSHRIQFVEPVPIAKEEAK